MHSGGVAGGVQTIRHREIAMVGAAWATHFTASRRYLGPGDFLVNLNNALLLGVAHGHFPALYRRIELIPHCVVEPLGVVNDEKAAGDDARQRRKDLRPDDRRVMAAVEVDERELIEAAPRSVGPQVHVAQPAQKKLRIHHVVDVIRVRREVLFHLAVVPLVVDVRLALIRPRAVGIDREQLGRADSQRAVDMAKHLQHEKRRAAATRPDLEEGCSVLPLRRQHRAPRQFEEELGTGVALLLAPPDIPAQETFGEMDGWTDLIDHAV